ncbi:MAG: hypothetical protein ACLGQH_05485 [Acidobacteriota bacterium]
MNHITHILALAIILALPASGLAAENTLLAQQQGQPPYSGMQGQPQNQQQGQIQGQPQKQMQGQPQGQQQGQPQGQMQGQPQGQIQGQQQGQPQGQQQGKPTGQRQGQYSGGNPGGLQMQGTTPPTGVPAPQQPKAPVVQQPMTQPGMQPGMYPGMPQGRHSGMQQPVVPPVVVTPGPGQPQQPYPGYPPQGQHPNRQAKALMRCNQHQAYCAQNCNRRTYGQARDMCNNQCNAAFVNCTARVNSMR